MSSLLLNSILSEGRAALGSSLSPSSCKALAGAWYIRETKHYYNLGPFGNPVEAINSLLANLHMCSFAFQCHQGLFMEVS